MSPLARKLTALGAALMLLAVPSSALARGGGGGITPTPTPTPTDPGCAVVTSKTPSQTINRKAQVKLDYTVTNCSTSTQTYNLMGGGSGSIHRPDVDPPDYTCTVNPWSAGLFTLKPGETKGFSTSPQGVTADPGAPALCPIGTTNLWTYTMDARDSAGTVVSNTAISTVNVTLAF